MLKVALSIEARDLNNDEDAKQFAEGFMECLEINYRCLSIEPYEKFYDSYKFEFEADLPDGVDLLTFSAQQTARIVSPWLLYYSNEKQTFELVFIKSHNTQRAFLVFGRVLWGHWRIIF